MLGLVSHCVTLSLLLLLLLLFDSVFCVLQLEPD
jgi:hypothetical protein